MPKEQGPSLFLGIVHYNDSFTYVIDTDMDRLKEEMAEVVTDLLNLEVVDGESDFSNGYLSADDYNYDEIMNIDRSGDDLLAGTEIVTLTATQPMLDDLLENKQNQVVANMRCPADSQLP